MAKFKKTNSDFGKIIGKTGKVLYWLAFIFILFVAGAVATSAFNIPGGIKIFNVLSGSMEPKIHVGSIVIVQPEKEYKVGDIITFLPKNSKKGDTVTHRIFSIKDQSGNTFFETKGDANNAPDSEIIPAPSVLGKEIFSIPLLGYPVGYAKTREGLIFIIIIPATIIIYSELLAIKNETAKLLAKRRTKKLNLTEKAELEVGEEEIKLEKWYHRIFKKVFKKK